MFGDHNPFPFSSSASSLLLLLPASRPSSFLLLASFTASISARNLKYRLGCISATSPRPLLAAASAWKPWACNENCNTCRNCRHRRCFSGSFYSYTSFVCFSTFFCHFSSASSCYCFCLKTLNGKEKWKNMLEQLLSAMPSIFWFLLLPPSLPEVFFLLLAETSSHTTSYPNVFLLLKVFLMFVKVFL